jgi:hypothetical protein
MADDKLTQLELFGRHVPDFSWETDPNGSKVQVELPGTFEVGFVLEGVFRPIYTLKAAGLLADIARLKASNDAQTAADAKAAQDAASPLAPQGATQA